MAGSRQRWAIAPPALDTDAQEQEELPRSGETPRGVMACGELEDEQPADPEVSYSPSGWLTDPSSSERAPSPDEVTGLRRAPEAEEESVDTIPAPPCWTKEPPSEAG